MISGIERFFSRPAEIRRREIVQKTYYDSHTIEQCLEEVRKIKERHPDRIPVLIEQADMSRLPNLDKKKFLVPGNMSLGEFTHTVRRRLVLTSEMALFLFTRSVLPSQGSLISELYDIYKDDHGFLVIYYSGENVFGN